MKRYSYNFASDRLSNNRVFRDAIFNYIEVDNPTILALINTSEMQRLRRIKQLGGTSLVYQSAEHSRFTHSLGVYHIIKKMCEVGCVGSYLSDYDQLTVLCAGLLHDIGHGPFSHSFEDAFLLNHEKYSQAIILGDSEVHQVLTNFDQEFAQDVAMVIAKTHPNKILVQMVSSQLDADRMDYLLRDSYFTGTTYGQFDLARLLRVMQVKDGQIVFKKSGVQAIEDYILARYQMYWQVYFHPTSRSFDQLLIAVGKRMRDLYHQGFDFSQVSYLEPLLAGNIGVKEFLKLDEATFYYYFKVFSEGKDPILADLCKRVVDRKLFTYLDIKDDNIVSKVEEEVQLAGFDPKYYVLTDDIKSIPYLHYGDVNQMGEIRINDNEQIIALPEVSEIVGAIITSNNQKHDHKVYFPR